MVLRTTKVSPEKIKLMAIKPYLNSMAQKAWRLGLILALGIGFWLGLRWTASAFPAVPTPQPALNRFLADGGGGAIEVWGIYAPEEYFRQTKRDPGKLGLDPARQLIFFLLIDTHEHDEELSDPETWWDNASLRVNGNGGFIPSQKKLVINSDHHQTVALAFQQKGGEAIPTLRSRDVLELVVPDLGGTRTMEWRLPLGDSIPPRFGTGLGVLSLAALLPVLAGLLVAFSPCLVHMTTYYIPLFAATSEPGATRRKTNRRAALVAGLFALGFSIPYTAAGVAVGYAGQFFKEHPALASVTQPMALVAGAIVVFFGLQVAGVFRLPFMVRLNLQALLPEGKRTSYLSSGLLGLNLAVGCLGCVGGSLFASLLLYSGVAASPVESGLILFLFALAANAPFFVAALSLGRFQLRNFLPLSATRYVPLVSGALLIALGLLMLSRTESLLEDTLIRALGIQV